MSLSKETFKSFVKNHPDLVQRVHQNEFSWQELYEAYDLYGEDIPILKTQSLGQETRSTTGKMNWHEFSEMIKSIDLDTVQKGVIGLQKAISLIQDLGFNKEETPKSYEERPIYKYYED